MRKRLTIVTGPTASGKTKRAIEYARLLDTEIVSCDSRQCYSELNIGVARPSEEELAEAPHHFIACRSVRQPWNVYDYEQEAMALLHRLFETHNEVVAVGGSGLYVEALCQGVAVMPDPAPGLREQLQQRLVVEGIASLQEELQRLDPDYYARVDRQNPARLQRALEVCLTTGQPYSRILAEQQRASRPFDIDVRVVSPDLEDLRRRIDTRVDQMFAQGLFEEASSLWHLRHLNTLNTVGYREFYVYATPQQAAEHLTDIATRIKLDTWHYAKKQITWCKKKYPSQRL